MAESTFGLEPRRLLAWLPLYLPSLVAPLAVDASLAVCAVCSLTCWLGVEFLFPRSVLRHFAGGFLAVVAGVSLLFFAGTGQAAAALFLLLPLLVLLKWRPSSKVGVRWRTLRPVVFVVGYGLTVWLSYGALRAPLQLAPISDDFLFSLRAQEAPAPLSAEDRLAAVSVVHSALRGEPVSESGLSARLLEQRGASLWVTLYPQGRRRAQGRGMAGPGRLVDQLREAASAIRDRNPPWMKLATTVPLQIDLGSEPRTLRNRWARKILNSAVLAVLPGYIEWDLFVYDYEPGVDGLLLQGERKLGVVLPGDVIRGGWRGITPRSRKRRYRSDNLGVVWERLVKRSGVKDPLPFPESGPASLQRFRTYAFALPSPAERRTVEVYRQNVLLPQLDEEGLVRALGMAGEWLLSTVEEDGRFDYEYFPARDRHGKGYNEVRHAGSVYGLFHMARLAQRERRLTTESDTYVRAGLRALDRVYGMLGSPEGAKADDGFLAFLEASKGLDKTNSGATALTLLSFLERPSASEVSDPLLKTAVWNEGDDEILKGLAKTLEFMIDDAGAVYEFWHEAAAGGGVEREPYYYPGEAMLALALYFERTSDSRWLEAAKKIGRRQARLAARPFAQPDHWVMQALEVLERSEPTEPLWRDAAYAMGQRYVREQHPPHPSTFPDYLGSFRRQQEVPRTTRAAARGEAVGAVMRVAWRNGDPAAEWERSVLEGSRHLVEQMWRKDNSFFLPNPQEALGAIRMGIIDTHCRIDNNQHAIVALGNALSIHRRRATQGDLP